MKTYKIFSKRKAHMLCNRGFKVVGTVINNLKPWLYVYLFEESEELKQAIKEISEEWNQ